MELTLVPIGHVDLMPPAPTAGLAVVWFLADNCSIAHIGEYKQRRLRYQMLGGGAPLLVGLAFIAMTSASSLLLLM